MPNMQIKVLRKAERTENRIDHEIVARKIETARKASWLDDALESIRNRREVEAKAFFALAGLGR